MDCIPNWYESAFWWGLVVFVVFGIWSYGRISELKWDLEYYTGRDRDWEPKKTVVKKAVVSPTAMAIPGAVDDDHLEPIDEDDDDVILPKNARVEK